MTSDHQAALLERINGRTARVGIIGIGYVGLPLAVAFAEAGFTVVGIDVAAHGGRPRGLDELIAELRETPPSGFVRVK